MAGERAEVGADALAVIQAAFAAFAKPEIDRLAEAVIADLRSRNPVGIFDALAARPEWDEHGWSVQEGPFDIASEIGGLRLPSPSEAWDMTLSALIRSEVETLPRHALVVLSAHAAERSEDWEDEETFGFVRTHGIVALVREVVDGRASRRDLDLIGPDRADTIPCEVEGRGLVRSALSDRRETRDILCEHLDAIRTLLIETDILPALEEMRADLLARMER